MNEQKQMRAVIDDLRWVLESPALLASDTRLWNPRWLELPASTIADHHLDTLLSARQGKLGRYFEALVSYLFHTCERFDVLAENQLIFNGNVTLGELDLLLQEKTTRRVIHLELALKFYLWVPNTPAHEFGWIGSGLRDFLADKVARLTEHQLQLPNIALTQDSWPSHLPTPDAHYLWMPGRLYLPPSAPRSVIAQTCFDSGLQLNPAALTSSWYISGEQPPDTKTLLHKSDWLNGVALYQGKPHLPAQFSKETTPPVYVLPPQWHTNALLAINRRVHHHD